MTEQPAEALRRTVLMLCTGNSCRSQMAEGIVNHDRGDRWRAVSAGTRPGTVHPLAIRAMAELGIDISAHRSKHVDELRDEHVDLVISVCGNAERDCPVWLGRAQRLHIPFDDPADAVGTEDERMEVFRRVRDELRAQLPAVLDGVLRRG